MSGALTVGKVRGIPIRIHWSLLLVLPVFAYLIARAYFAVDPLSPWPDAAAWAWGAGLAIVLFASVLLHELGHSLVGQRLGVPVRSIVLFPLGGVTNMPDAPEDPGVEAKFTVVGPLVNFAVGLPLLGLAWILTGGDLTPLLDLSPPAAFLTWAGILNLAIGAFNLFLPAFPMDGGRLLRAFLATRIGFVRATRVAAFVGRGLAILMALAGFLAGSVLLMLIAVFVWFGAVTEARQVEADHRHRAPGPGHV